MIDLFVLGAFYSVVLHLAHVLFYLFSVYFFLFI